MARLTYQPGEGFPARLRAFLMERQLRFADVERDTGIDADTIGGWQARRHYPEQLSFLAFCRHYELGTAAATRLLRLPDEPLMELLSRKRRQVERLLIELDATDRIMDRVAPHERAEVKRALLDMLQRIRKLDKCSSSTSPPEE